MPLNTVLPSSITEEHRRPAELPQTGVFIRLEDGRWAFDTTATTGDGEIVALTDGRFAIDDTSPGNARVVLLGRRLLAFKVS